MANQKISLVTVSGLSTGDVYRDIDVQSEAVQNTITNVNAIRQSVRNILTFSKNERILYPEFGNGIRNFVFDRITETMMDNIKSTIINMLEDEPRITVADVTLKPNVSENEIMITVTYEIPSLSKKDTISLSVNGAVA